MKVDPDLKTLAPDWLVPDNVVAMTTLRYGGVSEGSYAGFNIGPHVGDLAHCVDENRNRLVALLDEGVELQWLEQVHGVDVIEARRGQRPIRADAAFTASPLLACCVMTADCLPVFLASRSGTIVALAHAGWRGLAAGVIEATIAALSEPPSGLVAWLGPAIGPCHFEVGEEVVSEFLAGTSGDARNSVEACFHPGSGPGKYLADLYGLARIRLTRAGVTDIGGGGYCTYCDESEFYSYRRDGQTGRMASLIYLR